MDSLTVLSTEALQAKRAALMYKFRACFAGVPSYVILSHETLHRDRNQMLWEIRRVDRELRRRTDATAPMGAHIAAGQGQVTA